MNLKSIQDRIGSASISLKESVVAGDLVNFVITYTAGYFGIDDTGSIKICTRFATDMGRPQFNNPAKPNYVSIKASNGATLEYRFDSKANIRPWDKTIYVKVVKGFFRKGDKLIIHFGDPKGGCPGMRMQTFCEKTFEFKILVDAFATYQYVEIKESPVIKIIPGQAVKWIIQLPTLRKIDEKFCIYIKAEDLWGNPTNKPKDIFQLKSNIPLNGLPQEINFSDNNGGVILIEGLSSSLIGDIKIDMFDKNGKHFSSSNPLRIIENSDVLHYWGELHGQSEETIGTNSIYDYFIFARDKAGLDVIIHQGNDFQITNKFWEKIQETTKDFLEEGKFVTFPGYEWSGNTGLGGDRNVIFFQEGELIRRSSHALVDDLKDSNRDCNSSDDLFNSLKETNTIVFAHVGGRYADIKSHDVFLERSVEIHSAWGTFEWLLYDSFSLGYRMGIVCNSDGHKGRPGSSYPGASMFGSYGGLTCFLSKKLNRNSIWESLLRRHHYGTTGNRIFLDVKVILNKPGEIFLDNPILKDNFSETSEVGIMGDIIQTDQKKIKLKLEVNSIAPIEKIEIRNGINIIETFRPYEEKDLGKRLRVIWAGAEYRGRGRETIWDGHAIIKDNQIEKVTPINFYNHEKKIRRINSNHLEWEAITTGGFGGFDCTIKHQKKGFITITTNHLDATFSINKIGYKDIKVEAGGLDRHLRVVRLPEKNPHCNVLLERDIELDAKGDNPIYVCVIQEDGNVAWSSPIYLFN